MTASFSHLALAVSDLERLQHFYVDALGFEAAPPYASAGRRVAALMEAEPTGFRGVFMRSGDFLLELLAYVDGPAPAVSPRSAAEWGYAHISLVVEDLTATLARVESAGGAVRTRLSYPFADGQLPTDIVFVTDPDGNRIELIAHRGRPEAESHGSYLGLDVLGWPAIA